MPSETFVRRLERMAAAFERMKPGRVEIVVRLEGQNDRDAAAEIASNRRPQTLRALTRKLPPR